MFILKVSVLLNQKGSKLIKILNQAEPKIWQGM